MNNLADTLRRFVTENFLFGVEVELSDDDSFVDRGIIDSTGTLELIAHLEGTYGITIEDHELVPENLDSIGNLTRFVTAKCEHVPAASSADVHQ